VEKIKKWLLCFSALGQLGTQEESRQHFPTEDSGGLTHRCTARQRTEAKAVCTPGKGLLIIHRILKGQQTCRFSVEKETNPSEEQLLSDRYGDTLISAGEKKRNQALLEWNDLVAHQ